MPNTSKKRQHPSLVKLGSAIRSIRKEQGLSQEKLALHAEIDRSYIGRIERGDNNVAFLTLERVAAALDISVEELLSHAGL